MKSALVSGLVVALLLSGCKVSSEGSKPINAARRALASEQDSLPLSLLADESIGHNLAIDGDTIVVGVSNENADFRFHVLVSTTQGWTVQQSVTVPNTQQSIHERIGLSGDTIVVGSRGQNVLPFSEAGAVYVYARTATPATPWTLQQKIVAPDPEAEAHFGGAVAIDNDTIVVGATNIEGGTVGAADGPFVFSRAGTSWDFSQKLISATDTGLIKSLEIDGDLAAVSRSSKVVRIFSRTGAVWEEEAELVAQGGEIKLGGQVLVVGPPGLVGDPTVQVFERQTSPSVEWAEVQVLSSPGGPSSGDTFGVSLALDGDRLLVGAPHYWLTPEIGEAYLYERTTAWTESLNLKSPAAVAGDLYGVAASLSGNVAVISASGEGDVWIVRLGEPTGTPCSDDSECLSNLCADGVCCVEDCSGACSVCSIAAGGSEDGICTFANETVVCRAATGPCDKEETCSSTSFDCPPDELKPDDTPCPGGVCQAGTCTAAAADGGPDDSGVADLGPGKDGSSQDVSSIQDATQDAQDDVGQQAADAGEQSSGGGCQVVGAGPLPVFSLLALLLLIVTRRRAQERS